MRIQILFMMFLSVFLLEGCLDDETNFGYSDVEIVDTVYITDLSSGVRKMATSMSAPNFRANPGQPLRLEVRGVYHGEEKLHYVWKTLDERILAEGDTLSHIFVPEDFTDVNNMIMLYAFRGDKPAANVYQISITINKLFGGGLVVLARQDQQTYLDYCQRIDETKAMDYFDGNKYGVSIFTYLPHLDVFSRYNDGEQLRSQQPVKMTYGCGLFKNGIKPLGAIQILDQKLENSVAVNVADMKKITSMDAEFLDMPAADFLAKDFYNVGALSLLLSESGEIYTRINYDMLNPNTGRFSTLPLVFKDANDLTKPSEKVVGTSIWAKENCAVVWEEGRKRFLVVTGTDDVSPYGPTIDHYGVFDFSYPNGPLPEGAIPMNNFDKELCHVGLAGGFFKQLYVIYKDGGDYYLQNCELEVGTWSASGHTFSYKVKSSPMKLPANTAAVFEQEGTFIQIEESPSSEVLFFVCSGKSIYLMNPNTGVLTKFAEFNIAGNQKLTHICKLHPWFTLSVYGEIRCFFAGRIVAVAFDNGDVKIVRSYDDAREPDKLHHEILWEKNYNGGVYDLLYYTYTY